MTAGKKVSVEQKDALFAQLRRNILIARLKVSLDKELNRPTTAKQKALAEMKLPPMRSKQTYVSPRSAAKSKHLVGGHHRSNA